MVHCTIAAAGSSILYPVMWCHHIIYTNYQDICRRLTDSSTLMQTIDELAAECDTLRAENRELKALLLHIDDSRDLAQFKKTFEHDNDQLVQVIMRHITDTEQYILINAGASADIKKDMIALHMNSVVGRVVEVYSWYAKVQLITDPQCCIPAYMVQSETPGIYVGLGLPDEAAVEWTSHLQEVLVGDDLVTSGEGLIFPRGYQLGTVQTEMPSGLYHKISIKPAIDPHALTYCLIHQRAQ